MCEGLIFWLEKLSESYKVTDAWYFPYVVVPIWITSIYGSKQFIINSNDIFDYILKRVDRTYLGINDIVSKLDVLSLEKKMDVKPL